MVTDQDYWDEQQKLIESQAAEIDRLENKVDQLEWENKGVAEWRDVAKEYKSLCDQMACQLEGHYSQYADPITNQVLEAWRAVK